MEDSEDPVEAAARKTLQPGERLLWRGRPAGFSRQVFWLVVAILIPLFAIPLFWALRDGTPWGAVTFIGTIAFVKLAMSALKYFDERLIYAVTDRRVLMVHRLYRRVEAYALGEIRPDNVEVVRRGVELGVIRFMDFAQRCDSSGDDLCAPEFRDIAEPERVAEVVRTASEAARGGA